jgi:hypothetical protein
MAGKQVALLLGASCNAHGAVENPQHPLPIVPLSPSLMLCQIVILLILCIFPAFWRMAFLREMNPRTFSLIQPKNS